jgi:hypothetical protein
VHDDPPWHADVPVGCRQRFEQWRLGVLCGHRDRGSDDLSGDLN